MVILSRPDPNQTGHLLHSLFLVSSPPYLSPFLPVVIFCFLFATNVQPIGIFLRLRGAWNAVLGAFSSLLPDSPRSLVDETRGDLDARGRGSFWPQPLSTDAFYTHFRGRGDSVFCWSSTESRHSFRLCSSIHSVASRRLRCS